MKHAAAGAADAFINAFGMNGNADDSSRIFWALWNEWNARLFDKTVVLEENSFNHLKNYCGYGVWMSRV